MSLAKKLIEQNGSGWVGKQKRAKITRQMADRVISDLPNNELPEVVLAETMAGTMKAFLAISQEKLKASIWKLDVRHEGDLYESVRTSQRNTPGSVKGSIIFNFYGRFPDMGVGKGMSLYERQSRVAISENRKPNQLRRQAKPWFTSVWGHERHRLAEVITRDMARPAAENLHDILPDGQLTLTM